MKVDVKREPGSRAVLEVEIPVDTLSQGVEAALRRLNQRVEIPGFRRGKAPRTMLERYVGRDAVLEEAVKALVPDAHPRAGDQARAPPPPQRAAGGRGGGRRRGGRGPARAARPPRPGAGGAGGPGGLRAGEG